MYGTAAAAVVMWTYDVYVARTAAAVVVTSFYLFIYLFFLPMCISGSALLNEPDDPRTGLPRHYCNLGCDVLT